ncbi:MAG: hypothetical protein Q7K16_04180 [Candidatus Azambacteria bacterium]|nr:hypothetical protein [Candidatus Azambacteria bacterium]
MKKSQNNWGNRFLQKQEKVLAKKLDKCLEQQKQAFEGLASINNRHELKDSADNARAVLDLEIIVKQACSCRQQIFKVSQAILNITEGKYGFCGTCRKKITIKRLRAVPEATICTICKEAEEKRQEA